MDINNGLISHGITVGSPKYSDKIKLLKTYLSFFFVVASTTQSPTQFRSVPFGRRSTLMKKKDKYAKWMYLMRNAKEIKMLRLTIPSWRNLTLVITNIIGLEPVRSRMRAKKLPLKSTISTYRKNEKIENPTICIWKYICNDGGAVASSDFKM